MESMLLCADEHPGSGMSSLIELLRLWQKLVPLLISVLRNSIVDLMPGMFPYWKTPRGNRPTAGHL